MFCPRRQTNDMPRAKRKPAPLNGSWGTPTGNVAFVTREGQYDTARKRARFNAHLFDPQRNPVLVPGRSSDGRLRINIPESDTSDPAKVASIVRGVVEVACSTEPTSRPHHHGPVIMGESSTGPSPATQGASSADPELQRAAVREGRLIPTGLAPLLRVGLGLHLECCFLFSSNSLHLSRTALPQRR